MSNSDMWLSAPIIFAAKFKKTSFLNHFHKSNLRSVFDVNCIDVYETLQLIETCNREMYFY